MKRATAKILFSLLACLGVGSIATGQSAKYRVTNIPVERNGIVVRDPWTGGMDSPQFSVCDLNQDGIKDLFIFDRAGNKILTYLSNGDGTDTMYNYAPQYEELFPQSLYYFALIRDFNNDGIPDIFAWVNTGIQAFKGSIQNGRLHFDLINKLLKTPNPPDPDLNIYLISSDIPVFTDVNHDGDIDILVYSWSGVNIEYYENQSMEHPGDPHYALDSLKYMLVNTCWGAISQNSSTNGIILYDSLHCLPLEPEQHHGDERHQGNAIYDFDLDNDGDVDLLNGNIGYNNLLLLKNCGNKDFSLVCEWDSIYPLCDKPINLPTYPAAFGVDVNSDSYQDLLISPTIYQPTYGMYGKNVKNVLYYKNNSTGTGCTFQYQSDSFLVHHTLDFGSDSKPVFYDMNGDGLLDIIVGGYGYYDTLDKYTSSLAYYQNIGTATQPKFKEITTDYNHLSSYGLKDMNPAFGDLDGDGKADMLLGDFDGYLHFFKNTGTTGSSFPVMTTPQYFDIRVGVNNIPTVGVYSAPFIYDVDGDSLNDIIVGRNTGKVVYYRNLGTKTNPVFNNDSVVQSFGQVNVKPYGNSYGYAQPSVAKDASDNLIMYVGSGSGTIYAYAFDRTQTGTGGIFTLIDSNYLGHTTGMDAALSVADINNDGYMEYLLGTARGGLMIYSDSLTDRQANLGIDDISTERYGLAIYPNPAKEYFVCTAANGFTHPQTEVYNVLAERMEVTVNTSENNKIFISAVSLSNGFYIVRISDTGKTYSGKIFIER